MRKTLVLYSDTILYEYVVFYFVFSKHSKLTRTSNVRSEGRADDVEVAAEFDGDEVVAGRGGHVRELVALVTLGTGELHIRGTLDHHTERAGASVQRVHEELGALAHLHHNCVNANININVQ